MGEPARRYVDLIRAISEGRVRDNRLEPCPPRSLAALRREYPDVPQDFLSFLAEVGRGSIGNSSFIIYGALVRPEAVYDRETAREYEGVLLFGDDFCGYNAGFVTTEGWRLVEIGPGGLESLDQTFETFIRERFEWATTPE